MGPAQEWDELVAPWRAAALRLGFAPLERAIAPDGAGSECCDYFADGAGTFLDLHGALGALRGFWTATLHTFVAGAPGAARVHVWTVGEARGAPRPPGVAGALAAALLRPLLRRLAPADRRPLVLSGPGDLARAVEQHRRLVAAHGGSAARLSLQERFVEQRGGRKGLVH